MQPWATHRSRAELLRDRYPFAAEVLGCYLALLDVWDSVGELDVSRAASDVVPRVVAATQAAGPDVLAKAVAEIEDPEVVLAAYLAGAELGPVELYLARASLYPLLARSTDAVGPPEGGHCPRCGGLPQVSVRGESGDPLVSVLSISVGALTANAGSGHAAVAGSGTSQLTLSGTAADINAALATAQFVDSAPGNLALTVTTTDTINNSQASGTPNTIDRPVAHSEQTTDRRSAVSAPSSVR